MQFLQLKLQPFSTSGAWLASWQKPAKHGCDGLWQICYAKMLGNDDQLHQRRNRKIKGMWGSIKANVAKPFLGLNIIALIRGCKQYHHILVMYMNVILSQHTEKLVKWSQKSTPLQQIQFFMAEHSDISTTRHYAVAILRKSWAQASYVTRQTQNPSLPYKEKFGILVSSSCLIISPGKVLGWTNHYQYFSKIEAGGGKKKDLYPVIWGY